MSKKTTLKAIIGLIMFFLIILALENPSLAASFSVSAGKTSMNVGESTTLTINANDCLGQFTISSSDASIVSVGEGSKWIENTSASVNVSAKKAGKATITVTAANVSDSAGYNDVTGSKSVTITVNAPQTEKPSTGGGSSNNSGGGSNSTSNKSSDATLKSITVGGKKYSNPNTDITIGNVSANTSSIDISAETNNSKAKVSGTGSKDLVTGTNKITLTVTAENGATKTYIVRVTRLAEESTTPNVVDENPPEEINDEGEEIINDLRLTSLTIEGVELIPEFNSETFEYSVYITDLEELKIDAVANLEGANIEITGNTELIEGENVATIKLTKDDKVTEYKITINKTVAAVLSAEPEENIISQEENLEGKVGFIGMIKDWWNRSGPITLTFTAILIFLGIAVIFAIVSYKYSNGAREASRHGRISFIQEENDMSNKKE